MPEDTPRRGRFLEVTVLWATIVGALLQALVALRPAWAPLLPIVSLFAGGALVSLLIVLGAARKRVHRSKPEGVKRPTILLVAAAGSKGAARAEEIVGVARGTAHYAYLEVNTCILAQPLTPQPNGNVSDGLAAKLDGADAVVVMTDIPWERYPTAHKAFIDWCYRHPDRPVIGHVPDGGVRPRDFAFPIPEDSDGGFGFLAHALLGRAVSRGELLHGWSRMLDTTAIGLGVALGVAITVAVALRQENGLYQRLLQTPPTMQAEIVNAQAKLRAEDSGAKAKPEEVRDAKRRLLTSIAKAQLFQIQYISGAPPPDVPRLMFHARHSASGKTCLCEVASSEEIGGCLAADQGSIAGCAFSQHLAVAWRGHARKTEGIRAWRLDGEEVRNNLPCRFQPVENDLPKKAILCLPIGTADEIPAEPIGTVCVSLDEQPDFLDEPWLRALLLRTGNALAGMSFDSLVDDTVKCTW